jgi:CRISPR/Cas system-associated endonuclease/helicase Cas3
LIFAKCGKIELNHTVRLNLHNNIDMFLSKSLFEEGGAIADKLPGYKIRPQQLQMVEAVEEAINGPGNLIVEAGTGVGKSLAYLIPFINWASEPAFH